MKEITILSGKGGTGKTTVTAALAAIAENTVFSDSDVDAADLHLILKPTIEETFNFSSGITATINTEKCTACNTCREYCRFGAITVGASGKYAIDPYKCEGCLLCQKVCPENAVESHENTNNRLFISSTRFGSLIHAQMAPGVENSGKLVTEVRKQAKIIARRNNADFILNDGPPGIGCAAIASVTGADSVLIVLEPSRSALHDADRLISLVRMFSVPVFAVINKCDLDREISNEVISFLKSKRVPLLSKFLFSEEVVDAMVSGKSIVEYNPASEFTKQIEQLWKAISIQRHYQQIS